MFYLIFVSVVFIFCALMVQKGQFTHHLLVVLLQIPLFGFFFKACTFS